MTEQELANIEMRAQRAPYASAIASFDVPTLVVRLRGLEAEAVRLRWALAWYADASNWTQGAFRGLLLSRVARDGGRRARAALGEGGPS